MGQLPSPPLASLRLGVVGLGAVGVALVRGLADAGARVWLVSRRSEAAAALERELATARVTTASSVREIAGEVDALLLCVSEVDLEGLAAELAEVLEDRFPDQGAPIVLHTNGLYGTEPLAPLVAAGCACGRLHPLVSLPPVGLAGEAEGAGGRPPSPLLQGVGFALGGDPEAYDLAARLAEGLGGVGFELREDAAALYHASASLLAGGTVALFAAARRALEETLADDEASADALARALFASVARNLVRHGPEAALTGPAARGAGDVVAKHMDALREVQPALADVYRVLAEEALELALARGSIDALGARAVRAALDPNVDG